MRLRKPSFENFSYFERWAFLGIIIGLVSGLAASAFFLMIRGFTSLFFGPTGYQQPIPSGEGISIIPSFVGINWILIPLITTLGGLLVGILIYKLAPEAEGHGTEAVIDAFHNKDGKIRSRVPFVKMLASAITLGSGGSAGREGPVAHIGAGFGSWISDKFKLSDRDRRIMIVCGTATGIGSIFKAPLGGALFAVEVLYRNDMETDAIIPAFVSSVISYSVFSAFFGFDHLFTTPDFLFTNPINLLFFAVLGIICAAVARIYINMMDTSKKMFSKLPIPKMYVPAVGGLFLGLLAVIEPGVLGGGYGWLQLAIDGNLALKTLLLIGILKIFATSFTIGSGGSGGVFAPSLVIGGMTGAVMGHLLNIIFPTVVIQPTSFVLIGMAALFAGAASVPLASMILVAEMTGNYNLLIPAMLACSISYALVGKRSLYKKQVLNRSKSPAHIGEFSIDILEQVHVRDVMASNVRSIDPNTNVKQMVQIFYSSSHRGYPVMENNELVGIVAFSDLLKISKERANIGTVKEIMSTRLFFTYPNETLDVALHKMTKSHVGRLLVVDPQDTKKLLGILTRGDLIKGHEKLRHGHQRTVVEVLERVDVYEIMQKNVVSVNATDTVESLVSVMKSKLYQGYPVMDKGNVVGIVTLKDIINLPRNKLKGEVREIMNRNVVFAYSNETVKKALDRMYREKIGRLPVVKTKGSRKLIGILTKTDIIRAHQLERFQT